MSRFALWLGLFIGLSLIWIFYLHIPRPPKDGFSLAPQAPPLMLGVMGYDAMVNGTFRSEGTQMPYLSGWRGHIPVVFGWLMILSLGPVFGWPRNRSARWLQLSLVIAVTLLILAAIAFLMQALGVWSSWVSVPKPVIHEGYRIPPPNYPHIIFLVVIALFGSILLCIRWIRPRPTLSQDQRLVRRLLKLSLAVFFVAGVLWVAHRQSQFSGFFTAWVLSQAVGLWAIGAISALYRQQDTSPLCLTHALLLISKKLRPVLRWISNWTKWSSVVVPLALAIATMAAVTFLLWLMDEALAEYFLIGGDAFRGGIESPMPPLICAASAFAGFFLLYAALLIDLHRNIENLPVEMIYCLQCGYDLRGTVTADRHACPECGRTIHDAQFHWIHQQKQ